MRLAWTIALCVAWACGRSPAPTPSAPAPAGSVATAAGAPPAGCSRRAADFAAWVTTVARENESSAIDDELVEVRDARPVDHTLDNTHAQYIPVSIDDLLHVDGNPAATSQDVEDELANGRTRGRTGAYVVFVDRRAPMARVGIALAGIAAAGGHSAVFVFRVPKGKHTMPPPSSVTDEILAEAAAPTNSRAERYAHTFHDVVAGCPGMLDAIANKRQFDDSRSAWIDAFAASAVACHCAIDFDALRATLWLLLNGNLPDRLGVVDVALAGPGDAAAITLSGATWADAAPALLAAHGKPIRVPPPTASR